ncbi:isocitrate lyase/PEP mutase family protein [Microbulbifer sp. OS29]|uniref:Isocitrate lyase/PEP mutase family protein n=1 Tax=Microbulbifer okhotskensis TaxID=2926617 RepID=A0A9X2J7Q4_9GAMM|nr:isocitrate lyase/PEP mutase family protein [Microbulbifer okhotskensis]MCO1334741.1 isocitrate lyase/PEP mutase family protein [Microbulbifer okhotskensis]
MHPNFKSNRVSLKKMAKDLDGRLILAIGVGNGAQARILHELIYALEDEGKIPDFIGGFIYYCSGYLCAADLGFADMGYILRGQMEHQTHVVESATWFASVQNGKPAFPIGVDIDTGYGNEPSSVILAVRQMHKLGAQFVQIEDQFGINKSCGHMAGPLGKGKEIISTEEMIKYRLNPAISYAKDQDDLLVVARTDAVAVEGTKSAIAKAIAFSEAGADILFVEAPENEKELQSVADELKDTSSLVLVNVIEGSPETPYKSPQQAHKMGFNMAIYPLGALFSSNDNLVKYYRAICRGESAFDALPKASLNEWFDRFGAMIGRDQTQNWNQYFTK